MSNKKAIALAEKITSKAEDALSKLNLEMTIMKWPPDFRAIMWAAVADMAAKRRDAAAQENEATP